MLRRIRLGSTNLFPSVLIMPNDYKANSGGSYTPAQYDLPAQFVVYSGLLPINTHTTRSYLNATVVTGYTAASHSEYQAAGSVTQPYTPRLKRYENGEYVPAIRGATGPTYSMTVYDPNSNPSALRGCPYAVKYARPSSVRYPAYVPAYVPLNPALGYATPRCRRAHATLALPLISGGAYGPTECPTEKEWEDTLRLFY